jgi:hypothetical protein
MEIAELLKKQDYWKTTNSSSQGEHSVEMQRDQINCHGNAIG